MLKGRRTRRTEKRRKKKRSAKKRNANVGMALLTFFWCQRRHANNATKKNDAAYKAIPYVPGKACVLLRNKKPVVSEASNVVAPAHRL